MKFCGGKIFIIPATVECFQKSAFEGGSLIGGFQKEWLH
jgi:hypothetical protein